MLTYEQQLDLVKHGYAKVSINKNLSTFKYARRVFHKNLWNNIPGIMECRGHTYNNITGELVLAAPTKSFNYGENGYWLQFSLDTPVVMYKKYNGFMATVSKYNEEIIVGTTGSTKSDFAKLAKAVLIRTYTESGLYKLFDSSDRYTMLFEICDASDPHIVDELSGAHLLGIRYHESTHQDRRSWQFEPIGSNIIHTTLAEALHMAKNNCEIEGWMMYNQHTQSVCKLKTDYYIDKKKLMRMSPQKVHDMFIDSWSVAEKLSHQWKFAPDIIVEYYSKSEWIDMSDQQRRIFLEKIFK